MKCVVILTSLFALNLPGAIYAQWSAAPHIVIAVPRSDFANVSGVGGGFGIKVIRGLGGRDGFGLRGDFAYLSHGSEPTGIRTNFGLIPAQIKRASFRLTIGPQYSFGSRNFKMYGGVAGGFYLFRTSITDGQGFDFASESDAGLGWNLGAGFQYDIGLGPWLDVALEYQVISNVTTETPIEDSEGQIVEVLSEDITANEFTIKVGVIFFLK